MRYSKRYAYFQECYELYSNRIRKSVYKMNDNKMQETQRIKEFLGPGTTPWITEFLVYLFLQLNNKIKIAKTRVKKVD